MWVAYLDFMRNQWESLREVEEVEDRYQEFNPLAVPYKSAFAVWLGLKQNKNLGSEPYKRNKIS
jgi:hypothetical protein